MHIHSPKPPHSWGDLFREIGVIVVGILIALAAEQVIETLHWRERVEVAETGVKAELRVTAINAYERLAVQPCLKGQITTLATRLRAPGTHWAATPMQLAEQYLVVPPAYLAPSRVFTRDVWQDAVSSGVIGHMPDGRAAVLSQLYYEVESFAQLQEKEASAASQLAPLSQDLTLSPTDRLNLLSAVAEVDRIDSLLTLQAEQFLASLRDLHRHYPVADVERDRTALIKDQRAYRGACVADRPLDLG